jgi:hypothetical protein
MVRILANGMTFGGADKIASALGETNTAARTAAARQRAGIAGDLASVLGPVGDIKLAGLGLKALPTIAKTVFSKAGAIGAGLGLGTLATYNARTSADTPKATPKAAAKKPDVNAVAAHIAQTAQGARAAQEEQPAGFDGMVARLAAGQDGMISLRQLGALSEAAQRGAQADYYSGGGGKKAPAPGDLAGRMLEQQYVQQFNKSLQDPKADPAKAQQEFESKVLQLRKTQFIDPYGLQDGGE